MVSFSRSGDSVVKGVMFLLELFDLPHHRPFMLILAWFAGPKDSNLHFDYSPVLTFDPHTIPFTLLRDGFVDVASPRSSCEVSGCPKLSDQVVRDHDPCQPTEGTEFW